MQQKGSDLWEQKKLSLKAKYLDVTLNFFTCERKTVNENNWLMDAHLILFGTRLHADKPIWILWISIVFILERNRFYYSKTDCIGIRSRAPLNFTGHLRFWLQKYFVQIGGNYLQEKSLPLLFLETLWSCHGESGKWKFERTVTLMGRWPKTNVYHIDRGIYRVDHLKRNCIGTI